MQEKEIDYIKLINETSKKYPCYVTPITEFMRNVINILDLLLRDDFKSTKYEKINSLAKCLYEQLCNENPKWKYGDKEPRDILVDLFNKALKGEKNND